MKSLTKENSITARQISIILLICVFGLRLVMLPGALVGEAGNASYISFLIAAVLTFTLILAAVFIITKNAGQSFKQILENSFGRIAAKIILLIIMFFFIYKSVLADLEMEQFMFETLYENISWSICVIPIFLVIGYAAYKGPRVLGRSGELFYIFGIGAVLVSIFLALPNVSMSNALPVFNKGFMGMFRGSVAGFTLGGEFLFLLILCENLTEPKKLKRSVMKYSGIALLIVTLFIFVFTMVYGDLGILIQDAIVKLPQFSASYRPTFHIDSFIVIAWMPMVIIYTALSIYCAAWCLKNILNLKSLIIPIIVVISGVLSVRLFPSLSLENLVKTSSFYFAIVSGALQLLLPSALLIGTLIKKRRAKNDNK